MPTPHDITEEMRVLRDVIRAAHEAVKDLRAAIRDANRLAPDLTKRFEEHADKEIAELDNMLQAEMNRKAADLNTAVHAARVAIVERLMSTDMVLDPITNRVSFHFPPSSSQTMNPHPDPMSSPKEGHQP